MAVYFELPEDLFADPCWEPSDCSLFECNDGRVKIYCHYSERQVAIADTIKEGESVLRLAVIRALERDLAVNGDSEFVRDALENKKRDIAEEDWSVNIQFQV